MNNQRIADAICFVLVMSAIVWWGMSAPGGM
jgi:hypothetical protein